MADRVIQLVARLESVSGLSEDSTENVLHVGSTVVSSAGDYDVMMEAVRDFFIELHGAQTLRIGAYIGESISRGANKCHVLAYHTLDLSGATPFGAPIDQLDFTMTASASGDPFPEEVACVVSYHGDLSGVPVTQVNPTPPPATIRPQQRRRGRMYVGPLNTNTTVGGAQVSRPSATFRSNLALAFAGMANEINALANRDLGVWSKVDEEVWPAEAGWIDDAWDVQRRRGAQTTLRDLFTI